MCRMQKVVYYFPYQNPNHILDTTDYYPAGSNEYYVDIQTLVTSWPVYLSVEKQITLLSSVLPIFLHTLDLIWNP